MSEPESARTEAPREAPQGGPAEEADPVLRARRAKLAALQEKGILPYAYRFERTHPAQDAGTLFRRAEAEGTLNVERQGPRIAVAGRLVSQRSHGKSAFADLVDFSGRIQLYLRLNVLGEEAFANLELLDLGDWVGARGPLFRTRAGEITVRVEAYELLAKSLRALPIGKEEIDPETGERRLHSAVADLEARYRQRYVDLAVHPEVRDVFVLRSRLVRAMRAFLDARGYVEVETPVLQPVYGGAMARPFVTHHNVLDIPLYLRIADELYLKRLVIGGFERVYEISKDFRNEGMDRLHNPEFTMLEFYQAFADYLDIAELVEEMISRVVLELTGSYELEYQGTRVSFRPPFARTTFYGALSEALGADARRLPDDELRDRAFALHLPELDGAGRGRLLDKLFGAVAQPKLEQPTFVMDYPLMLSPLAKAKRGDPELTERFELFAASHELANAFSELNDPIDQRRRFEEQARLRALGEDEAHQIDEDFLRALEFGMPPTGGVGIGIDRLAMVVANRPSIRDVILFPALRPTS
ncbi:MAG: lysine--tRNA ligase [Gemmatimonadetes bacterium]|nr:lysine--tRNA ligase [Gemmatimonadota bacterium]